MRLDIHSKEQLRQRMLEHTTITPDSHWLWTGYINDHGYGQIGIDRKTYKVNRLSAYIFHNLDLISNMQACHKDDLCRHKNCWNPEHLYAGTRSNNDSDKIRSNTVKLTFDCGHDRTEENTCYTYLGRRQCRLCHNECSRKSKLKMKEQGYKTP
jgi:hypothetical protein